VWVLRFAVGRVRLAGCLLEPGGLPGSDAQRISMDLAFEGMLGPVSALSV
jgi:hypothetical protein